jgi:SSS family solute:Na+ symporter
LNLQFQKNCLAFFNNLFTGKPKICKQLFIRTGTKLFQNPMPAFHPSDLFVFFAYLVILLGIGFWAGRKKKASASDLFITRQSLPWFVISFSFIASAVSSQQLIGSVGFAYRHGLAVANWEWLNGPAILLLVFLFIPFYVRKKVITMPQFLEMRYNGKVRSLFAFITLLTYVFINLAGILYSGAFALEKLFNLNLYAGILILAVVAGTMTIYGGLETVAWANVWQSLLLLGSGLLIFFLGWQALPGGLSQLIGTGDRAHLVLPSNHPDLPGTGLFVLMISTNIWFFCTNQSINQSALGAKNIWHAQMGVLVVGILSILVALADVFPGLIAYALNPNLEVADEAYVYVVNTLVPTGLKGLLFAVLCGGALASIEALANAASTIFTIDIFQKAIRPNADSRQLVRVGRITIAVVLLVAALWSPLVQQFEYIFSYFQECWAFISVPVAVIFVMGVLWKGVTDKAAFLTLCLSFPMLVLPYLLRLFQVTTNVYNVAGFVLLLTVLFCWGVSLATKQPKEAPLVVSRDMLHTARVAWYKSIWFWAVVMIVSYILLYAFFW